MYDEQPQIETVSLANPYNLLEMYSAAIVAASSKFAFIRVNSFENLREGLGAETA